MPIKAGDSSSHFPCLNSFQFLHLTAGKLFSLVFETDSAQNHHDLRWLHKSGKENVDRKLKFTNFYWIIYHCQSIICSFVLDIQAVAFFLCWAKSPLFQYLLEHHKTLKKKKIFIKNQLILKKKNETYQASVWITSTKSASDFFKCDQNNPG